MEILPRRQVAAESSKTHSEADDEGRYEASPLVVAMLVAFIGQAAATDAKYISEHSASVDLDK